MDHHLGFGRGDHRLCIEFSLGTTYAVLSSFPYLCHETLVDFLARQVTQAELAVQNPPSQSLAVGLPPVRGAKDARFHQFPAFVAGDLGEMLGATAARVPGKRLAVVVMAESRGVEVLPSKQGQEFTLGQERAPGSS